MKEGAGGAQGGRNWIGGAEGKGEPIGIKNKRDS